MNIEKGKMYQGPEGASDSFRKVHQVAMNRGFDRTKDRVMFYIADRYGNSFFDPPVIATAFVTAFEGWTEVEPESQPVVVPPVACRSQAVSIMCRLLDISEFTVEDSDRADDVRLFVDNVVDAAKQELTKELKYIGVIR